MTEFKFYVYSCSPIDFWNGWRELRTLLVQPANDYEWAMSCAPSPRSVQDRWNLAQILAQRLGWEGDCREGPYWAPIPVGTGDWDYIIAWKQDNNGETFIATPVQLTWLHKEAAQAVINERGEIINLPLQNAAPAKRKR